MTTRVPAFILGTFCAAMLCVPLLAHAPSGAIFTTVADGSEVNANIYPSKDAVYLDGGPGPGAPQTAAGLDDGRYIFQVTDPSGKKLLSTDAARCRQFDVANGIITNVVATGCQHKTGFDVDHGAVTIQLMPYLDTPNPGGVYKVWVTLVENYKCLASVVDCGFKAGVNVHGFVAADSKTDNYKIRKDGVAQEIDTRFFIDANGNNNFDDGETVLDGAQIFWMDTLGGTNSKSSYFNAALDVNHEAHVEAPEDGTHYIAIPPQPGCNIGVIDVGGIRQPYTGPQVVAVQFPKTNKPLTIFITVQCVP
ncbi:MAG TPA: hypothetical protein VKE51_22775 [Vicinamibacterales bacterium]|nr:hypothetical protein [Vicinamibacterales bacterium]